MGLIIDFPKTVGPKKVKVPLVGGQAYAGEASFETAVFGKAAVFIYPSPLPSPVVPKADPPLADKGRGEKEAIC